jgi:predicted RNA-binding Zn-ribbon protein involved in translation (DUF1610 family)
MKKGKDSRLISRDGLACPRCGRRTEIWEHSRITDKHKSQFFYYRKWYRCPNLDCSTTVITREEDKVYKEGGDFVTVGSGWKPEYGEIVYDTPPWAEDAAKVVEEWCFRCSNCGNELVIWATCREMEDLLGTREDCLNCGLPVRLVN